MFKKEFKYFKSKRLPPEFGQVIDFHTNTYDISDKVVLKQPCDLNVSNKCLEYGLVDLDQWKIYELKEKLGLIFIENPFTRKGQRYWVKKCLQEYTKKPNKLNLDPFNELGPDEDFWEAAEIDSERGQQLRNKLRWATLGYHHNWDTKEYSDEAHGEFPPELAELCELVVKVIGDAARDSYHAEAAIINFYHLGSTLSGHKDVSEPNMNAPLLSISFGQSAVFLVGGETLDCPVTAVLVHSGDVVVMSGQARHYYHGVPRILIATEKPWAGDGWENTSFGKYLEKSRINMNVRQVLPPNKSLLNS